MERHEWVGPDVWSAHLAWREEAKQRLLAQTGTGMAHWTQCNARLDGAAAIGLHNPGNVPVLCGRALQTSPVWIGGQPVVRQGEIAGLDRFQLAAHARKAVRHIAQAVAA